MSVHPTCPKTLDLEQSNGAGPLPVSCACRVHCPLVQRAGTEERGTEEERDQMLELEPREERNGGTQRQNSLPQPKDPGKRKVSLFPVTHLNQ